jgi:hypothetical protein
VAVAASASPEWGDARIQSRCETEGAGDCNRKLLWFPICNGTVVRVSHRLQRFIRKWLSYAILGLFGPFLVVLILLHRRVRRVLFVPFARWLGSKLGAIAAEYRRWQP